MREITGDIWTFWLQGHPICITTNGHVKRNGEAVMGRGIALQAATRIPELPRIVGAENESAWDRVQRIAPMMYMFPVKRDRGVCAPDSSNVVVHKRRNFVPGLAVPGWALLAETSIIADSLRQLDYLYKRVFSDRHLEMVLPRPGCGAGGLDWGQVRPLCEGYGDWLLVITRR